MRKLKSCVHCGTFFITYNKDEKYCSFACQREEELEVPKYKTDEEVLAEVLRWFNERRQPDGDKECN